MRSNKLDDIQLCKLRVFFCFFFVFSLFVRVFSGRRVELARFRSCLRKTFVFDSLQSGFVPFLFVESV